MLQKVPGIAWYFFCFIGFRGQKGGEDKGYEADCTKKALVLFRCPEIRCSKKSAAEVGGGGT